MAVRLLCRYAETFCPAVQEGTVSVHFAEWNINQGISSIVRGIVQYHPDVLLFSTYIWNRLEVFQIISDIRSLYPDSLIGSGGPEVSWNAEQAFVDSPGLDLIIQGEGEQTFRDLVNAINPVDTMNRLSQLERCRAIPGIYCRTVPGSTSYTFSGERTPLSHLDSIPFPYRFPEKDLNPEQRIIYYESSRGCPFTCSYCLSSIDKRVRYYSLERVFEDLSFFLNNRYPLVKFVDRTFNLDPARYLRIWEYIRDNWNSVTCFHFEIAAEYLDDNCFLFLASMPEGSIQFEIGIQTTNERSLQEITRKSDPDKLSRAIRSIPPSIHTHVDLIAGLPHDTIETFSRSFDYAFSLHADMLQLGFLKILPGTIMENYARTNPTYAWSQYPPYEVLRSTDMGYQDLVHLKEIEQILDTWYNNGLLRFTLHKLEELLSMQGKGPFSLFADIVSFIKSRYERQDFFLPRKPADSFSALHAFIHEKKEFEADRGMLFEWLHYDFLRQGKPGAFPDWFIRRYDKEAHFRALESLLEARSLQGEDEYPPSRRRLFSSSDYHEFLLIGQNKVQPVLFLYRDTACGFLKNECITLDVK